MNTQIDTHNQNTTLSTGARLRSAREQLGLTQQEVAERLCLKVSTVRDIEEDKAPTDLVLTFLRGYIRSYAKLVNIPEDELLLPVKTSIKTAKITPMQNFFLEKYRKKHDIWLIIFTWLLVFIMVGLTCVWWWQVHDAQQDETIIVANKSSKELHHSGNSIENTSS